MKYGIHIYKYYFNNFYYKNTCLKLIIFQAYYVHTLFENNKNNKNQLKALASGNN